MWLILLLATFCPILANPTQGHVFCYYGSRNYLRDDQANILPVDLEPALEICSHLLYVFSGVESNTHNITSLNDNLDLDQGYENLREFTNLKKKFPKLKVLLSIGGGVDLTSSQKYTTLLETIEHRTEFINSTMLMAKSYGFDGIDLAWQFPETIPSKPWSSAHSSNAVFDATSSDNNAKLHRSGFTALVQEFRDAIANEESFLLTTTVLPNVNSTIYHNIQAIIPNLDAVVLDAFDHSTPSRNPYKADFTSSVYPLSGRNPELNVEYVIDYWLRNGASANKLVLGIPTYSRAWKMTKDSDISGVPPITTDGATPEGSYTKQPGLLSYPEVMALIIRPQESFKNFIKVSHANERYGNYAFRLPDSNGEGGQWVSYEDPETVGNKAEFAKIKELGGFAIVDLTLDNFKENYPLLNAANYRFKLRPIRWYCNC